MEHETLFTASKWDILKRLEKGPANPLELSKTCKTSIANISQQLRLLEMAGLVTSKRISNRDKGKPRILYSLTGDLSYLIATTGDFVEKKSLHLSAYNKVIMRIWFYEKTHLRYTLEKVFWQIEEHFDKISFLAVDTTQDAPLTLYVEFKRPVELKPITITEPAGTKRQVVFSNKLPKSGTYVLYVHQGNALEKER